MLGSAALDVAIGLILVYIILSLMCSAINELLEGWLKHRSVDLERGIREMLADPSGTGFAKSLYEHPLINGMFKGQYSPAVARNLPSYIPSRNFALALMDIVMPADQSTTGTPGSFRAAAAKIENAKVQRALLALIDAGNNEAEQVRANIEQWFNSSMDRVSGWYKRRKQIIIVAIGVVVAVAMNVSTITVAKTLWTNATLRDSIAGLAQDYLKANQSGADPVAASRDGIEQQVKALQGFGLPFGWSPSTRPATGQGWAESLVGWLLTASAISLGAPFWFDVLNRVSVIRSTVKPHEKSPEEKSKG